MTYKNLLYAGAAAAALAFASPAFSVPVTATYVGDACPGTCVDLAGAGYAVSGGAIVNPSATISGVHKTPGEDTGNSANVSSYNVTSQNNNPNGAQTAITVSNLNGLFDLYWGSIDTYNMIDFFSAGSLIDDFSGTDANGLAGGSSATNSQFNIDGYFTFAGDFDEVVLRSADGVAFEVAAASQVPEPGTLALLGLGLIGLCAKRRFKA